VLERSAEVCVQVADALKAHSARHLTKQESQLSKDDKKVLQVPLACSCRLACASAAAASGAAAAPQHVTSVG
jgi:hypothetical protein